MGYLQKTQLVVDKYPGSCRQITQLVVETGAVQARGSHLAGKDNVHLVHATRLGKLELIKLKVVRDHAQHLRSATALLLLLRDLHAVATSAAAGTPHAAAVAHAVSHAVPEAVAAHAAQVVRARITPKLPRKLLLPLPLRVALVIILGEHAPCACTPQADHLRTELTNCGSQLGLGKSIPFRQAMVPVPFRQAIVPVPFRQAIVTV